MPLKKDPDGRRYVEAEVEVPGSPEEVWHAIASGPGISSWFVPYEVEERLGGALTGNFGPGMESISTITAWDPPHRFTATSADFGPGNPEVATEWVVEAKSGDTCIVRVVHSLFTESDDWDGQLEGFELGWPAFFRILRMYLTYFRGQHGAMLQVMGTAPEPKETAWRALLDALGFRGRGVGEREFSGNAAPTLDGVVEWAGVPDWPEELFLRLDEPAPGVAHVFPLPMAGRIYLSVRLYLYGDDAPAVVATEDPRWQAWMTARFPMTEA